MSFSTTLSRADDTGDALHSSYSYGFLIQQAADLLVTVADTSGAETVLTLTTDYTVSGVDNPNGGSITLVNASQAWLTGGFLKTGYHITVRRAPSKIQSSDYRNQSDYFPESIEDTFDRLVMMIDDLQDQLNRALKFRETSTTNGKSVPEPQANYSIKWDPTGSFLQNYDPASVANLNVTPPANGFSTETNAQSMLSILNPRIHGSTAAATAVTSSGLTSDNDVYEQVWFVKGSPGSIDLSPTGLNVNPQISAGTRVGQKIKLIGCDNVNTLTLGNGNGVVTNGQRVLDDGAVLEAVWNGSAWQESYFNNL